MHQLDRKTDHKIVYQGKVWSWVDILAKNPIENKANERIFRSLEGCQTVEDSKFSLNYDNFQTLVFKVADNCVNDVNVLMRIVLNAGYINEFLNENMQILLTSIYLGYKTAPQDMNHWEKLNPEIQEKCVYLAFKHQGLEAYQKFNEHQYHIDELHTKTLMWFWKISNQKNKLKSILDYLKSQRKLKKNLNLKFIAEEVTIPDLLKPNSFIIDKQFISFDSIHIQNKGQNIKKNGGFDLFNQVNSLPLRDVSNFVQNNYILKQINESKKMALYYNNYAASYKFRGANFENFFEVVKHYPLELWATESLSLMIDTYIKNSSSEHSKDFWETTKKQLSMYSLQKTIKQKIASDTAPLQETKFKL